MAKTITFERPISDPRTATAQLKKKTRYSYAPYQGSIFLFGEAPLRGRVSERKFSVGLNRRDWLTLIQPTARGRVVTDAQGARLVVNVGLPPLLLWYLRTITLLVPLMFIFGIASTLWAGATISGGGILLTLFAMMLTMIIVSVGINMNNADGQVDELAALVEAELSPPPTHPIADPTRDANAQDVSAKRQRAQATSLRSTS